MFLQQTTPTDKIWIKAQKLAVELQNRNERENYQERERSYTVIRKPLKKNDYHDRKYNNDIGDGNWKHDNSAV